MVVCGWLFLRCCAPVESGKEDGHGVVLVHARVLQRSVGSQSKRKQAGVAARGEAPVYYRYIRNLVQYIKGLVYTA